MDADGMVADVLMAFCAALLLWILLVPLRERREAAKRAGKPLKEMRGLIGSPHRPLRIIGWVYFLCLMAFFVAGDVRMVGHMRAWPHETRYLFLMAIARQCALLIGAIAGVFGAAAVTRRICRRRPRS